MLPSRAHLLRAGWILSVAGAVGVRAWNAIFGPLLYGYDHWAHVAYVFFIDMYRALPYADQGWSYFHPPLHYLLGWLVMQAGDPTVLMVGLACIGSIGSLGVAVLCAKGVRLAFRESSPEQASALALLAFTAVAFLPVHLYVSPMPGNEMTAAFFGAAAVFAHLRNDSRHEPTRAGDALTGLLCGLAMLSKVTSLVPVLAVGASMAIRWLRTADAAAALPAFARRALVILLPLLLVAGPWYGRNIAAFGTPLVTSESVADVARVQADQLPGERGLLDYVQISPQLFSNSAHHAPHMLHSVWASTYLNVWFDTYREGQLPLPKPPTWSPLVHNLTIRFAMLGMLPSWIALFGALVALRVAWRDRDAAVPLAMLVLTAGSLAAYVLFTLRIPTWAALKGSYLLNLSLPFAYFLALGTATLAKRNRFAGAIAPLFVATIALAAAYTFTSGLSLKRHDDSNQHVSVNAHFGRFQPTRDRYRASHPNRGALEARAAVELLDGSPALAVRFYTHAASIPANDPLDAPYATNRLAVATALSRDFEAATRLLDGVLAEQRVPELLVNRGALHLYGGRIPAALADLREAVALDPSIPPAWRSLSVALWLDGQETEAAEAKARAELEEATPPRGFPYGIGTGYIVDAGAGQRWMLVVDLKERVVANDELEIGLYFPARARNRTNGETRRHKLVSELGHSPRSTHN